MGLVRTEIILINAIDVAKAKEGLMNEEEIRKVIVDALVDSGAWTLVINEAICEKLGLDIVDMHQEHLRMGYENYTILRVLLR